MKCDKVKELLLTDYVDDEVSQEIRIKIEEHINGCDGCRDLYEAIKERTGMLSKALSPQEPPREVWENISARIYGEEEQVNISVRERIKELFFINKLVMAIVSIAIIAVMGTKVISIRNYNRTKNYVEQQMTAMLYLEENGEDEDIYDFDTGIEEYFL